jgi:hypothetical protein
MPVVPPVSVVPPVLVTPPVLVVPPVTEPPDPVVPPVEDVPPVAMPPVPPLLCTPPVAVVPPVTEPPVADVPPLAVLPPLAAVEPPVPSESLDSLEHAAPTATTRASDTGRSMGRRRIIERAVPLLDTMTSLLSVIDEVVRPRLG